MPLGADAARVPVSPGRLFATQTALLLASVIVTGLTLGSDVPTSEPRLVFGLVLLVLVTAFVGLATWDRPWARYVVIVIPLFDLVAINQLRAASPTSGFGFLLVLPVAWLALNAGRVGAAIGIVGATTTAWAPLLLGELGFNPGNVGTPSVASTASLNVTVLVVGGVIAVSSERQAAQRRLLATQARRSAQSYNQARRDEGVLNAVMDAVPFGVVSLDPSGTYRGSNRAARAMGRHLGLPVSTTPHGMPIYHLDGVTPVAVEDLPYARGLAGDAIDGETYWVGHPDAVRVAVEVSGRLVLDADGAIDRLVIVFRDVGGSIEAEAARDQAVSSVSHEFRTPLSSILGYIELAADTPGMPDEAAEHLAVAERNTTRLLTLVNDLLAARGRAPRTAVPMTLAGLDLAEVVTESVTALRPLATDRVIAMTLDAPESQALLGDAFRLRQVVDNLVTNAIKYNVEGGSVTIDLTGDDTAVTLTITDTGHGMSEQDHVEVFQPYHRTAEAVVSTVPGSGLGLAISREIAERHGGTIRLESAESGGTTAVLVLPRDAGGAR
ncbi:sensor histidine kinase [Aeromicrobium alkaliterrae]|uniref:histidine kinase n=1 Tax=Aeromicrobium alkaliterrae TaxID=302168 RepID=A0ABN2JU29_9ACTN